MEPLRLGVVGVLGRGGSFVAAVAATGLARVVAVCDAKEEGLEEARHRAGADRAFASYDQMLDAGGLDGVILATPMPMHVPQAVAALERGLWVLSEVPAGVNIAECRRLTLAARAAARSGRGGYRMAENYLFTRPNVLVRELVRRSLFGQTYFADAEYIHDVRAYAKLTPWRRRWQLGIDGNTYCTHSLGPVLTWMPGRRVEAVACVGSGPRFTDDDGKPFENSATSLTLAKVGGGAVVKLRLDLQSPRPHAMTNYQLQGTDGAYESARAHGEVDRVFLASMHGQAHQWTPLQTLEERFLPGWYRAGLATAANAGHGGGDYFVVESFVRAMQGNDDPQRPALDVDAAMDMTLPGLCSQRSAAEGGRWVDVPDSRSWTSPDAGYSTQLFMTFPPACPVPDVPVPTGYRLRILEAADLSAYRQLMERAGFGRWDDARIHSTVLRTLPHGILGVEHVADQSLVATALANHAPTPRYPNGAELGWVAVDPDHRGRGLGKVVCCAVLRLLRQRGYHTIYLSTDDHRLPAIVTYLRLGFEPDLSAGEDPNETADRWRSVREALSRA